MIKPEELRDLNETELDEKFRDAKVELFNLRFQLATGQLDNPMKLKEAKRDIARIKTVMRARELAEKTAS
jgi:large subunit ribosomal protein L29